MSDKCPCTECICKPICYGKDFSDLIKKCRLITDYYYFEVSGNFESRYKTIVKILNTSGAGE